VLLLHGLPTSGRLWDAVVPLLQTHYTCIVVDLPGFGESPLRADGSLSAVDYAEDIERLRQQLAVTSWHIVGHDAGSPLAVQYTASYGEHVGKLVLCSAPLFPEFRPPWFIRLLRIRLLGDVLALLVVPLLWRFGIYLAFKRRDAGLRPIVAAFHQPFAGFSGIRRFVYLARWGDPAQVLGNIAARLPSVHTPTLIIHGQHEQVISPEFAVRAARLMPNAQAQIIDCGHFLPLDCPETLCEHLLRFFEGGAVG
jgi:pimeloyl-ACP methyl ester carboxylesterase